MYLIYLNCERLIGAEKYVSVLPLLVILPSCLLYIVGLAGDIQLFMHVATFVLLPALIWLNIGHKAARTILFPLLFMLFCIPVGEQLIPYLQEIAADGSVALLRMTGIPVYRNGLYIDIPQGRFFVAEACSGVSFFIASIVIGFLYTYLNLKTRSKQIFFILLSFLFPVAANIVRVYGIIVIAYYTDMEYAAGADHLIYGWFFFAFVIACLLGIGELLRDKNEGNPSTEVLSHIGKWQTHSLKNASVFIVFVGFISWSTIIHSTLNNHETHELQQGIVGLQQCVQNDIDLHPIFINPDKTSKAMFEVEGVCSAVLYEAWFSGQENELITDLNKPYKQQRWSLLNGEVRYLPLVGKQLQVRTITSPLGSKVNYASWYEIDDRIFTSKVEAKLYQTWLVLLGKPPSGKLVILGVDKTSSFSEALDALAIPRA
ncbi:hypothetical protein D210916BOD24_07870 [Alteromonas sp. D210916BOD_24]